MREADVGRDIHHHDSVFNSEHYLAWFMAALATLLAVVGALVSFDILNLRDVAATSLPGGLEGGEGAAVSNFQDAILLMLPAIGAALLAFTLHSSEHHQVMRDQTAMGKSEHSLAYLVALATIAFGVLAILIGFDVFDNGNTWRDGATWGLLSVIGGLLTSTLHSVMHHSAITADEAEIAMIVEQRLSRTGTMEPGVGGTTYAREPRR